MIDDIIRHLVPSPNDPVPQSEAHRLLIEERDERIAALRVIYHCITAKGHAHGLV